MAYSARFTNDEKVFTIERSGVYGFQINIDWTPPASANSYSFAGASSLNVMGGSELVSRVGQDVEFSVPLTAFGATVDHLHAQIRALGQFLQSAKYFEVKYSALPTPTWGQHGAYMRYEIVTAEMSTDSELNSVTPPARRVYVNLRVKPRFYGAAQTPALAAGGIFEDVIGSPSGLSNGLRIPAATTNKMTNPVFSHATWSNGWTAGANIIATQNIDMAYVYPSSTSSVKLTRKGATTITYTQSINAGNTNKHALSALIYYPGSTAPTSSDVVLYYGANLTTTFVSKGNGFYLLYSDNVDGINSATATGLSIQRLGVTLYLVGIQLEEKVYHTPICHGDMLGCAWSGTRGASTTARTASTVRLYGAVDRMAGAYELVWTPDLDQAKSNSSYANMVYATVGLYFNYSDAKWYMSDSTNTISSAAQTFAANTPIHIIGTYGPSGMAIYINGVSVASGATYTPRNSPTYIDIGEASAIPSYPEGVFSSFTYHAAEVTATQAAAMYADLASAPRGLSPIPWTHGNTLYIGSDTSIKNYMVLGGICGDVPARTKYKFSNNFAANPTAIYLSLKTTGHDQYTLPTLQWIQDLNGSADATAVGGGYTAYTTGTYPTAFLSRSPRIFAGKHNLFVRMKRSTSTETVAVTPFVMRYPAGITGNPANCATTASYDIYYLGSLILDELLTAKDLENLGGGQSYGFGISFSASGTIHVDYVADMPGEIVKFDITQLQSTDCLFYGNNMAMWAPSSIYGAEVDTHGATSLDLHPQRMNLLFSILDNMGIGDYLTATPYIEPAWSLV